MAFYLSSEDLDGNELPEVGFSHGVFVYWAEKAEEYNLPIMNSMYEAAFSEGFHIFGEQLKELTRNISGLSQDQIRNFLKSYCKTYQEVYWFEQLASVFEYWELENKFSQEELKELKEEAEEGIDLGRGEYFESLNNVSEAVHILYTGVELTFDKVKEVLNYIHYAHSCNESHVVFLERELSKILKLFKEITNK